MGEKKKEKSHQISLWILVVGFSVILSIHCHQERQVHQEQLRVLQERTELMEELLEILQEKADVQDRVTYESN